MRARIAASIALAAALAAVLAGCTFFTPQATLKHYDPSDGVNASVGDVRLSSALVLTEDGQDGNLLMSALNTSSSDVTLSVQWGSGADKDTISVDLPAGKSTQIGYGDDGQEFLANISTDAGGLLPIYFQYGDKPGKQLQVPVLDGSLAQYAELLPTATPTPTPTPNPTETLNPTPSPSSTP